MPLSLIVGKKKYSINLNPYLHWHYHEVNAIKKAYSAIIQAQVKAQGPKFYDKASLRFTLYPPSKSRRDRANFLSIHEKFFCDAIVSAGIIEDDSDKYIISSFYSTGIVDKDNPRVEIEID